MASSSCQTLQWLVVCPSTPKKETSMTVVIFFHSSVESCGGGKGIYSKEEEVCPSCPKAEEKDDHGQLPPLLSGEL